MADTSYRVHLCGSFGAGCDGLQAMSRVQRRHAGSQARECAEGGVRSFGLCTTAQQHSQGQQRRLALLRVRQQLCCECTHEEALHAVERERRVGARGG